MKRLRAGVIGSGIDRSDIAGCAALPDRYEAVALCGIAPGRRDEVAGQFGIPGRLDRVGQLFDLGLDLVNICAPPALYFDQAIQVMEAGPKTVIEKPVGRSLAEMDTLIGTEARTGTRACPIFQYRFGLGVQKLHHLIAKGVAGRPSVCTAETHWWSDEIYYGAAKLRGTWDGETFGSNSRAPRLSCTNSRSTCLSPAFSARPG